MDFEKKFEQFKTLDPRLVHLPDGVGTDFWETLYQMFKARLEAERIENIQEQSNG